MKKIFGLSAEEIWNIYLYFANILKIFLKLCFVAEREVAVAGRAAAAPVLDHLLDPIRPRLPVQPPALLPLPGPPPTHASRSQLESSSCSFHCIYLFLSHVCKQLQPCSANSQWPSTLLFTDWCKCFCNVCCWMIGLIQVAFYPTFPPWIIG